MKVRDPRLLRNLRAMKLYSALLQRVVETFCTGISGLHGAGLSDIADTSLEAAAAR